MNSLLSRVPAATVFLAALVGLRAWAPAEASLPIVELIARNGSAISTNRFSTTDGRWLLIYLRPDHHLSAELLGRMRDTAYQDVRRHLVIVVGGVGAAKLGSLLTDHPEMAAAAWYADPSYKAFAEWKVAGTPTIVGMDRDRIAWTLNGFPSDPRATLSLLASWVIPARLLQ